MSYKSQLYNWAFSKVHGNKLVYNTCWEDPRCDRMVMDFDDKSEIVMITSAGCNALAYLLDNPVHIHCVDMNFRQNSLLELKKAGLQGLEYNTFFQLFGKGTTKDYKSLYQNRLRALIPDFAQAYWDEHIKYFSNKGLRKSFYYRGTSGLLAFGLTRLMKLRKQASQSFSNIFQSISLEEQTKYFEQLAKSVDTAMLRRIVNSNYALTLAGVPENQQTLIYQSYEGGTWEYMMDSLRKTFTTIAANDNYFYKVYQGGTYTKECCPEYLKENNFDLLGERVDRVTSYTTTVSEFLKENPGNYTHFVLLDHQDWLAANAPAALAEEWELILQNSAPGTKILIRSAAKKIDFFPDFVHQRVQFDEEKGALSQQMDRVGTYASTYIGTVRG